jgi:hypothetical protein
MWNFNRARSDSVEALGRLLSAPEQRIPLARDYDIPSWIVPALEQLVRRERPMGHDEITLLGADWVLKLAAMREKHGPTISETHAISQQQLMAMRVNHDRQLSFQRTSNSNHRGVYDAVVPEPSGDQRAQMKSLPKLTKALIEEEFGLVAPQSSHD